MSSPGSRVGAKPGHGCRTYRTLGLRSMFQDAMARMDLPRSEARRQPRSKWSGGLNHEDLAGGWQSLRMYPKRLEHTFCLHKPAWRCITWSNLFLEKASSLPNAQWRFWQSGICKVKYNIDSLPWLALTNSLSRRTNLPRLD